MLRTVLTRVTTALRVIATAPSLRTMAGATGNDAEVIAVLEVALASLTQLCIGARARLEPLSDEAPPPSTVGERPLAVAVSRVLAGTDPVLDEELFVAWLRELGRRVPRGIGKVVRACVERLLELPLDRASVEMPPMTVGESKLPPGSRRTGRWGASTSSGRSGQARWGRCSSSSGWKIATTPRRSASR